GANAEPRTSGASIIGLCVPALPDLLVLEMLRTAYGRDGISVMGSDMSAEEAVRAAIRAQPDVICIAAAATTRGSELRNYCRRIRSSSPKTRIIVLRPHLIHDEA